MLSFVASLKSAGATTTALALAHQRQATMIEADPCGGDVAGWMGWPDLALSDLAVRARRQVRAELLYDCAQVTTYGLPVVAARSTPEGAAGTVAALVEVLPKLATETDLVVDVGRLTSVTEKLLPSADLAVVLVRPQVEDIARLGSRLETLRRLCGQRLKVALFGTGRYSASEIAATLGFPVAATIPYDPRTAAGLRGGPGRLPLPGRPPRRRLRRWRLLEAVNVL
jgi:hypothetical protein